MLLRGLSVPWNSSIKNYLDVDINYFALTPIVTQKPAYITQYGQLFDALYYLSTNMAVRAVINLRADVTLKGSGTSTNPYTVS